MLTTAQRHRRGSPYDVKPQRILGFRLWFGLWLRGLEKQQFWIMPGDEIHFQPQLVYVGADYGVKTTRQLIKSSGVVLLKEPLAQVSH